MHSQQKFSDVTKRYLCCFYEILEQMIVNMTNAELTESLSRNFIEQMIPHHRAAIEMSRNLLQYTTCIPLQEIASNIIKEQTKSIEDMQSVLNPCSELINSPQDICLYQRRFELITHTMFTQMKSACSTNDININFMREMIPHHQGAIRMSQNLLRYRICPQLDRILQAIIKSQREGVCKMERLLRHF